MKDVFNGKGKLTLKLICIIAILILTIGCGNKNKTEDYISKYNNELIQMLGDYEVVNKQNEHNEGFYDANGYDYISWKLSFKDFYGTTRYIEFNNDSDFDEQIEKEYKKIIREQLIENKLNKYFEINYSDYTYSFDSNVNYSQQVISMYGFDSEYDSVSIYLNITYDSNNLNFKSVNIDEFLLNKKITITKIDYHNLESVDEIGFSNYVDNLTTMTNEINNIISIDSASCSIYVGDNYNTRSSSIRIDW